MPRTAVVVFPHHLFTNHPSLSDDAPVYIVEEDRYFTDFAFHKKKLVFHRASMQYYRDFLKEAGYRVEYIENRDGSTLDVLFSRLRAGETTEVRCAEITDTRLEGLLRSRAERDRMRFVQDASPAFLTPKEEIAEFQTEDRRYWMARFYRRQRKRLNILIDAEGKPVGGKWSFDAQNRKPLPRNWEIPPLPDIPENAYVREAKEYVAKRYPANPGTTDGFLYPVTHDDAAFWFEQFLNRRVEHFGTYEDAIRRDEPFLFHSVLSPLLNCGLLVPGAVVAQTLEYAGSHDVSVNSLEGFLRQIIGWREFIRAVYLLSGEEQRQSNSFNLWHRMPGAFYTATTGIEPVDTVIRRVLQHGYTHHIERLMVLGNFMLLCRIDPDDVYRWFMEHFIDAYDWVMVPNVYGMSQYADGGLISTKPYISGSHYIRRMSDFPHGDWVGIWDGLFWLFVETYHEKTAKNPRLGVIVAALSRMPDEVRSGHFSRGLAYLQDLHGTEGRKRKR
jgi:deoxyribodipyrimidine photolyase-related protein